MGYDLPFGLAELDAGDVPVLVAVNGRAPLADWAGDGCHRGAAWVLSGSADPIAARLVLTEPPP